MEELVDYYGHKVRGDGYPLASQIWGHRLRGGQHWMEYLLEFLNVLAGFDYRLGQGLDDQRGTANYLDEYSRFTRLGLRRFVFYDEREKTTHPYDDRAIKALLSALKTRVSGTGFDSHEEELTLVRSLFRSFSAVEEERAWFAKSLFPAHHNLLFWEALRRQEKRKSSSPAPTPDPSPQEIDREISFTERNFFARGGEIYYLLLSAGTEHSPNRRAFISQRIEELLKRNSTLGELALIIDNTWLYLSGIEIDSSETSDKNGSTSLGWLPDAICPLYAQMAEDVSTFLESNLDSLECLNLLAHLIGFHIVQYIYHRAHPNASSEQHASGNCIDDCRPFLLIDALEGEDGGLIRKVSASLFREQEYLQGQRAQAFVYQKVLALSIDMAGQADFVEKVTVDAEQFFGQTRLNILSAKEEHAKRRSQQIRQRYQRQREQLQAQFNRGELDERSFADEYSEALTEAIIDDFRENFLSVHRKLAKAIGLVAPRKGPSGRFVVGDNLLKALVFANIPPDSQMTFGELLDRFYKRYGIIVGSGEASQSNLFDRWRINTEYYDRNREAFLEKMIRSGLVVQYSDATALVRPK